MAGNVVAYLEVVSEGRGPNGKAAMSQSAAPNAT
jgi:hypothetical protein